jgi:hypothetical protein
MAGWSQDGKHHALLLRVAYVGETRRPLVGQDRRADLTVGEHLNERPLPAAAADIRLLK